MTSSQHNASSAPTTIAVFQEWGAGKEKIKGITRYGHHIELIEVVDIRSPLPGFIDDPEYYIPVAFEADLALSFLKHPDLIDYLARVCKKKAIPLIASGKKTKDALTPFTCCGLGHHQGLGRYGEQFGFPELSIAVDQDKRIIKAEVVRGASCGATWEALAKIIGKTIEQAAIDYAREVQYLCKADPSAFDPISGKSALHYAGHVHSAAITKAVEKSKG
ncbi:MAG: DUF166 domain-containing protein [Desulfobulbaceae bacterium]|nr:DUF166 domain-containing protein [Desulfobulbaceae bacterium]HIJ78842.1 hypothetical protein [Deltaproteobacteria bacterium]